MASAGQLSVQSTQVVGSTLPIRPPQSTGVYAEEETRRLNAAFNDLFASLCDKRIEFLGREHDPEKLPFAYEFAREFRKVRDSAVQFLVDLCKPSQLRANPFLRGFYFSGVRAIFVTEQASLPSTPRMPGSSSFQNLGGGAMEFGWLTSAQAVGGIIGGLLVGWGVRASLEPDSLLACSDAFDAWVLAKWPDALWRREWPIRQRLAGATILAGATDLVLETADGLVLVLNR